MLSTSVGQTAQRKIVLVAPIAVVSPAIGIIGAPHAGQFGTGDVAGLLMSRAPDKSEI
jgi:hypothetical protein